MTKPKDPVYPTPITPSHLDGLTKREAFAMAAMQGLCANGAWHEDGEDDWDDLVKRITSGSVEIADALIKELNKPPQP
jgi:hypothetical protein